MTTTTPEGDLQIEVEKFNMRAMVTNGQCPTIACFGSRGSGKSVLMKDILYHYHEYGKVPRICVFSATEGLNSYFSSFVPATVIHSPVSVAAVTRVYEEQKRLKMRQQLGLVSADTDVRLILVLDDLAYSKPMLRSEVLRELLLNGRHSSTILIIAIQYLMDLPINCRSNLDFAFLTNDDNQDNLRRIQNQFASGIDFPIFKRVFTACTRNFEVFVLPHKKIHEEAVRNTYYYLADAQLSFKFGCAELWQFHDEKYYSELDKYKAELEAQKERRKALPKIEKKTKRTKETILPKTKRKDQIIHVIKG